MSDDADALEKSMAGRGHRSAIYGVILTLVREVFPERVTFEKRPN